MEIAARRCFARFLAGDRRRSLRLHFELQPDQRRLLKWTAAPWHSVPGRFDVLLGLTERAPASW